MGLATEALAKGEVDMTKWLRGAGALAMMSAVLLTSAAMAEAPKRGGELVMLSSQVPRHFNPAVQSGVATMIPGAQIFAMLVRADADWKIHPYLAESWTVSDDGLTYTFKLRANARFHDGQPITAEDVKFSIETQKANHPFKTSLGAVSAVETPDAQPAVVKLSQPHPALLLAMSTSIVPIIPKHVYGDGQDVKAHPRNVENVVGSGPFKLAEYRQGEYIVLERNDDFFLDGRPYLDKIVVRIIKDATSRIIAMENGDGGIYPLLSNSRDIQRLGDDKDLVVTDEGYAAVGPINWLAFNTKKAPLDDPKVRQAIAYAVDRNFITKALHRGVSKPAPSPIAPGSPFFYPEIAPYDLNLDKANSLLDAAGKKRGADGVRFSLGVDYLPNSDEQQKALAEYLKPQLKKIGIDVQVRSSPDFPTWAKRVSSYDFDMTMDSVFNWGDPVIGVHRTYLCSNIVQGVIWSNTQQYCNPKVDELLNAAGKEPDEAKRKDLYLQFQKIVAEDLPIYWINVLPYHTAYSKNLGNPPLTVWGMMSPLDETYWKQQ